MRIGTWALVGTVAMGLGGASLVGCGDSLEEARRGQLIALPGAVTFNSVAVGGSDAQTVLIKNEGAGDVNISAVRVSGPQGVFSVDGIQAPLTLAPNESQTFVVNYVPQSAAAATGEIILEWNNPTPTVVDLTTQALAGRIFVNPNPIDFGRVPGGETGLQLVQIQNIGSSELRLSDLLLLTSGTEFQIAPAFIAPLRAIDETGQPGVVLAPSGQPGDRYLVEMTYAPTSDGFDAASLIVRSSDPLSPEFTVPVQANGAEPCITAQYEDGLNFGPSLIGRASTRLMTVTNCSDPANGETLVISSLDFTDAVFPPSPLFSLDSVPALPIEIAPQDFITVAINYAPTEIIDGAPADRAMLRILSNDTYKSPLDIEITGTPSNNSCPTAVASCVVRGSGRPPSNEISVLPLDTLDCSAAGSSDPDGSIVEYTWEVLERPLDSTSRFANPNAPNSEFFVDLAGRYVLRLNLVDNAGSEACAPADVVVVSTPDEDIHIQLVWDTPGDPDQTDTGFQAGSDLDLHFLHPNGCWENRNWDCHFRAVEPNWGNTASDDDNPSLDIDDVDGAGPENINLNNPEAGVTYRVGVHYYNDHGYGPSTATVRIYIFGSVVFEQSRLLNRTNEFWEAAAITWPTASVTFLDRYFPSMDAAKAACP